MIKADKKSHYQSHAMLTFRTVCKHISLWITSSKSNLAMPPWNFRFCAQWLSINFANEFCRSCADGCMTPTGDGREGVPNASLFLTLTYLNGIGKRNACIWIQVWYAAETQRTRWLRFCIKFVLHNLDVVIPDYFLPDCISKEIYADTGSQRENLETYKLTFYVQFL